eukprot:GHVS01085818.1.p1 GENE.GHVS01085818.1~~GHVS01085818.1.p1  ORF type:complete len:401 (-),score=64.40 GHVS01085818.1:514-1716(-)
MGGGGGGGGALEKLFPGYKDKIWMKVPPQWRQSFIRRWNNSYETAAWSQYSTACRLANYHKSVVSRLEPSYSTARIPRVDYKRQTARGTYVEGAADWYLPTKKEQDRLVNLKQPYTDEEQAERDKHKFYSLKYLLGACGLFLVVDGFLQRRPIAWCLESPPPHPPHYPWWFKPATHGHDIASVRRGYEVYRQVCATCHSMKEVHFRHLTGDVYPEQRVKQLAASYDVQDGPNDEGEMYTRPGLITDAFPSPYPNNNAARFANGGSLPPDMSCLVASTHAGPNYVMAMLLGYHEPPAGVEMRSGLYYNTYFPGNTISMPPPLEPDLLEYEDGTAATVPQMAKDVTQFLTWASEPVHDRRKQLGVMGFWSSVMLAVFVKIYYRMYWTMVATRRVDFGKIKYM